MTLLFWRVGNRINQEILGNQRAEYGKRIVPTVSAQLEKAYGRNFTEKNVRRMLKFAEQFTDFNIVVLLSNQLSWSHFVELFPLKVKKLGYSMLKKVSKQGKESENYVNKFPKRYLKEQRLLIYNYTQQRLTFQRILLKILTY